MKNDFCPFLKSDCVENCKLRTGDHCALAIPALYADDFLDLVAFIMNKENPKK